MSEGSGPSGGSTRRDGQMHLFEAGDAELAERVFGFVRETLSQRPRPLGAPLTESELQNLTGETITESGMGAEAAFRIFTDVLAPACVATNNPRFLSFIPHAPTTASTLFDMALSASAIFADWWIEGAGAIHAENQALRWITDLLGWPEEAGGVFVSGGTAGNLSALAVGRDVWRRHGHGGSGTPAFAICAGGHSSYRMIAGVLGVEVIDVAGDERGRMLGPALGEALDATDRDVFGVAATAGTTNLGVIDDLSGIADVCEERGLWMHVDGAYGGAAIASPSARSLLAGLERSDSFVVDPHKWLFAPVDCAALLYRESAQARTAFTQKAEYIDPIEARAEWNPSDYAVHLSRRARGLPFWFSLATHGSQAYADAVDHELELARRAAEMIAEAPHLELAYEPELSIVLFKRNGWNAAEYQAWSNRALAEGLTLTAPTTWHGETLLRFCFINPLTTESDVAEILSSLE